MKPSVSSPSLSYRPLHIAKLRGEVLEGGELQSFLVSTTDNIDSWLADAKRIKTDTSRDVVVGYLPSGAGVLCKIHKEAGLFASLKCYLFQSKAERGHIKTKLFSDLGYKTPVSLGFLQQNQLGRNCKSLHFTAFLEDAKTLEDLFKQTQAGDKNHEAILQQLAILLSGLHADGYIHGDTKLSNFLLEGNEIYLIDLDGFKPVSKRWSAARDVARLLVGLSESGCSQSDMALFFNVYCTGAGCESDRFKIDVLALVNRFQRKHQLKYNIAPLEIL